MSPEPDLRTAPLAIPQRDWLGPPIHLHPYLGEIAGKDIVFDEPLVALALSGRGSRFFFNDTATTEIYTVPRMLEIQGAGSTID